MEKKLTYEEKEALKERNRKKIQLLLIVKATKMRLRAELHKSNLKSKSLHQNLIQRSYKKDLQNLQVVLQ